MNFRKERLKDLAFLTIAVVAVQMLLSKFVYPLFGQSTQTLFSISPTTALTSQVLGDKVIGILTGIVQFDLGQWQVWLSIFIGAFALLFAGYFVYDLRQFPSGFKGKNVYQKLAIVLFLGTAFLYAVLLLTKMSAVSTLALPLLIGLLINYAIIAFVVTMLAKKVKVLRI